MIVQTCVRMAAHVSTSISANSFAFVQQVIQGRFVKLVLTLEVRAIDCSLCMCTHACVNLIDTQ